MNRLRLFPKLFSRTTPCAVSFQSLILQTRSYAKLVKMPGAIPTHQKKEVKKLVLCFDGTGNSFQGNTGDTNIVKIYDKLDRDDDNQFHYYQPGIGTYDISGGSLNKGTIGNIQSSISQTIDAGLATTFDAHVIAGYKFLMRYYDSGDKIYMFGFSRGAFTARFLARMINHIGLLSKGNDEMVPFAYQLYQDYENAKKTKGTDEEAKMRAFTTTFCRRDKVTTAPGEYTGVKIYFLGIFDCVSSVKTLETPFGKTRPPVSVKGTAEHVRHAVAVDEFRVKFKAALLNQDVRHEQYGEEEDVKEVWFPGNHGDVGGGWPARSQKYVEASMKMGWWAKLKSAFWTQNDPRASLDNSKDDYQMSDIALSWMIRELEILGEQEKEYALKWSERLEGFKRHFNHEQALQASRHNTMRFGRGASYFKVMMWNLMDFLPLFPRWELEPTGWQMRTFPANMASARDVPKGALLHASLLWRLKNNHSYTPRNNHGEGAACLTKDTAFLQCDDGLQRRHKDVDHAIYALNRETVEKYKADAARVVAAKGVDLEPEVTARMVPAVANTVNTANTGIKAGSPIKVNVSEIFS